MIEIGTKVKEVIGASLNIVGTVFAKSESDGKFIVLQKGKDGSSAQHLSRWVRESDLTVISQEEFNLAF